MHIFHKPPQFNKIDPLGDGLGDDIAHEQREPERIELTDTIDADALAHDWDAILQDLKQDPLWFSED